MAGAGLGTRIAAYRRRRGLSQAALAGLVGRSESWLSQVERGVRSVDRLSVLLDLARVLHVDVEALSGRSWQYGPNGSALASGLDEVRSALTNYGGLRGSSPGDLMLLPDLAVRVDQTHRLYQSARYDALMTMLPEVLGAVEQFPERPDGQHREALLAYVSAYVAAAKLVTKLGAADLAILAADRAATAALEADSVVARGMAGYQVVCAMLRADQVLDGERLAIELAEGLTAVARRDDPAQLSVSGTLWLIAAVIAARKADRDEAWMRLK